jgi:hypothetical protein
MTEQTRGEQLASELEAANAELIQVVRQLSPAHWRLRGANAPGWDHGEDEVRTVGQIAQHTAEHHLVQMDIVRGVAEGSLVIHHPAAAGPAEVEPEPDGAGR